MTVRKKKKVSRGRKRDKARQGTHTHTRRINQLTTNKSTTITCVVMEDSTRRRRRGRGREHFPERNSPVASSKIIILAFFTNARARETNDR